MRAADVARHELIGLLVTVQPGGLEGTVVDETKHTFLVEAAPGSPKRVPKAGRRFEFLVGTERITIDGNEIMFRPEDRTKKIRR